MSSRKATPVTLAPRARQDFIDILRYTGETWGQAQLLTYRDKINDALQILGGNPQLGHHRDDLPSTHHAYLRGEARGRGAERWPWPRWSDSLTGWLINSW